MNTNDYFKQLLRKKRKSVNTLISETNTSKSTIYRVMHGLQQPSLELEAKIIEVLSLDPTEAQQLRYYLSATEVDEGLLSARGEVSHLLFRQSKPDVEPIELVYYDGEQYVRTFDYVLQALLSKSGQDNFACTIRLVNCNQDRIIIPLSAAISTLNTRGANYTVEHLVNFSTHDYKENIHTLTHLIPLLAFNRYSVRYRETSKVSNHGFFHNLLILEYEYLSNTSETIKKQLYLSFLPNNLSSCYVVNGEHMRDFFARNYLSLAQEYQLSLNNKDPLEDYAMLFLMYEMNHDLYLFKPSICYNRVPTSIWENVMQRFNPENFLREFLQEKFNPALLETHVRELLLFMETRNKASYLHKQVDIMTMAGLTAFAHTGLLLDHFADLPAFTKEEVKEILQRILQRDLNPEDPYRFHVLKEEYNSDTLTIIAASNRGLVIEYAVQKRPAHVLPYCIIEHKETSNVFIDFADNYIPNFLAFPQEEAHAFVESLIRQLDS